MLALGFDPRNLLGAVSGGVFKASAGGSKLSKAGEASPLIYWRTRFA
jgi:hypothetical protein